MDKKISQKIVFGPDPIELFKDWFALASENEVSDPGAMSLATVGAGGTPNVRMVLCKSFDADGAKFFTNMESTKGEELAANPQVALCFFWKSLYRQVRVQGTVSKLPDSENDAYFYQRHRESQLGACASAQSRPLDNMMHLITDVYKLHDKYVGQPVPRPPYWGGYVVKPSAIEFWVGHQNRLHERVLYTPGDSGWLRQRLYP